MQALIAEATDKEQATTEQDSILSEWRERLQGTNISSTTLLATDYLNHYNEVVMIVEMIPDMPDMLDEIADWQPKSYRRHFEDSSFSDRDLAIAAYEHVPEEFKTAVEETARKLDEMVLYALRTIGESVATDPPEQLAEKCHLFAAAMKTLIETIGATINGTARTVSQDQINQILGRA